MVLDDLFKIYFDEKVDLNLIKNNLIRKQNKYLEDVNKISERLNNKGFIDKAPKNIVDHEKNNYDNLKKDLKKISVTLESL